MQNFEAVVLKGEEDEDGGNLPLEPGPIDSHGGILLITGNPLTY
jgi:hypothetical protein